MVMLYFHDSFVLIIVTIIVRCKYICFCSHYIKFTNVNGDNILCAHFLFLNKLTRNEKNVSNVR